MGEGYWYLCARPKLIKYYVYSVDVRVYLRPRVSEFGEPHIITIFGSSTVSVKICASVHTASSISSPPPFPPFPS